MIVLNVVIMSKDNVVAERFYFETEAQASLFALNLQSKSYTKDLEIIVSTPQKV